MTFEDQKLLLVFVVKKSSFPEFIFYLLNSTFLFFVSLEFEGMLPSNLGQFADN
jgi:hypothetical protein